MVSNTIEVKQLNKERIRAAVQQHETCTKAGVAKETALSVATCSTILNEMLEDGEILKIDQEESAIGRPASLFAYNRDYEHVLGIRVDNEGGVHSLGYAVADALGTILTREIVHPESVTYELIEQIVAACMQKDTQIKAVGLGIPGVVQNGLIEYCDIKALENIDAAGQLRKKYNVAVIVENDMNFIIYQLYHRLSDRTADLGAVFFPNSGSGYVGCGFMINGRILKGTSMFSGELSYIAKAYGISHEQQAALLQDRAAFRKFAGQIVVTIICTINPACIVLMGNGIAEEDIETIRQQCRTLVPERHIPVLRVDNHIADNYMNGLVRLTLDSLQYQFTLGINK